MPRNAQKGNKHTYRKCQNKKLVWKGRVNALNAKPITTSHTANTFSHRVPNIQMVAIQIMWQCIIMTDTKLRQIMVLTGTDVDMESGGQ